MIRFTIPLEAVSKKNSQQILVNRKTGRPFISPSKRYKEFLKDCRPYLEMISQCVQKFTHDFDNLNIKYLFYMGTHRVCDLTNLEESLDDVLVHYGIIEDDNFHIVAGHDGSRVLYDKENPRIEVEIRSMDELDR